MMLLGSLPVVPLVATSLPLRWVMVAPAPTACLPSTLSALSAYESLRLLPTAGADSPTARQHAATRTSLRFSRVNMCDPFRSADELVQSASPGPGAVSREIRNRRQVRQSAPRRRCRRDAGRDILGN